MVIWGPSTISAVLFVTDVGVFKHEDPVEISEQSVALFTSFWHLLGVDKLPWNLNFRLEAGFSHFCGVFDFRFGRDPSIDEVS